MNEKSLLTLIVRFEDFSRTSSRRPLTEEAVQDLKNVVRDLNDLLDSKEYGPGSANFSAIQVRLLDSIAKLYQSLEAVKHLPSRNEAMYHLSAIEQVIRR